jgi:hypothetical protein
MPRRPDITAVLLNRMSALCRMTEHPRCSCAGLLGAASAADLLCTPMPLDQYAFPCQFRAERRGLERFHFGDGGGADTLGRAGVTQGQTTSLRPA